MKVKKIAYCAGLFVLFVLLFSCAYKSPSGGIGWYAASRSRGMDEMPADNALSAEPDLDKEEFDPRNFDRIVDNPFRTVADYPLSTFSIDVDTAGYSIMRNFLKGGRMPPKSAIRIEELINYFDYDYAPPVDAKPFAVHTEVGFAPWNPAHYLARIAIKGKEFPANERPNVNLVFLIDVSGSMEPANRLPLVIESLKMLVEELNGADKVAICVYAGAAGTVLGRVHTK